MSEQNTHSVDQSHPAVWTWRYNFTSYEKNNNGVKLIWLRELLLLLLLLVLSRRPHAKHHLTSAAVEDLWWWLQCQWGDFFKSTWRIPCTHSSPSINVHLFPSLFFGFFLSLLCELTAEWPRGSPTQLYLTPLRPPKTDNSPRAWERGQCMFSSFLPSVGPSSFFLLLPFALHHSEIPQTLFRELFHPDNNKHCRLKLTKMWWRICSHPLCVTRHWRSPSFLNISTVMSIGVWSVTVKGLRSMMPRRRSGGGASAAWAGACSVKTTVEALTTPSWRFLALSEERAGGGSRSELPESQTSKKSNTQTETWWAVFSK